MLPRPHNPGLMDIYLCLEFPYPFDENGEYDADDALVVLNENN